MKLCLSPRVLHILSHYSLPLRILSYRWVLPISLMLLLTTYVTYTVLVFAQVSRATVNIWDVVVGVLANRQLVHHGLINLLLYLISDLALLRDSSPYMLLRTGSRWLWFQLQIINLVMVISLYLLLLVVILIGVTAIATPWSDTWSSAAWNLLQQDGLPATTLLALPPLITTLFMLTLLGLTCIGIGMIVMSVTWATQNAILGFSSGLILNYSALMISVTDVPLPLIDLLWFHDRIFLWAATSELSPTPVLVHATLYWCSWIMLGLVVFWNLCRRLDIVAHGVK